MIKKQLKLFGVIVFTPLSRHQWRAGGLLFVAYIAATRISSALFTAPAVIFPASGIALGALFLEGAMLWPFVYAASFIGYLLNGSSLVTLLVLPAAHTLQAVLGAVLLKRLGVDPLLRRGRDMFALMATSILVSTIVPTFGQLSRYVNAVVYDAPLSVVTWTSWYTGTLFSLLIVGPFVIRWFAKPHFHRALPQVLEICAAFALLVGISISLFWSQASSVVGISLIYFLLLPLFWFALRLGPRLMTLALLVTSAIALSGTFYGAHALSGPELGMRLFQVQIFLDIIAVIFLILVSLEEERRLATQLMRSQVTTLRETLDKLGAQNRAKSEFIAMLAHELRNPLAPLVSSIELLKTDTLQGLERSATLSLMEDRMKTVRRLLDDLLDVSRISENKLKLEKEMVDLLTIISGAVASTAHYYEDRGQTLALQLPEDPVFVEVDPVRIEQVITNLLTNASKFSDPQGTVTLSVSCTASTVEVLVHDTGVGIEPAMIQKIFEPFQQIELGERTRKGLGIGLALVKSFVEMHDGKISVRSEGKGHGSTFCVALPLAKSALTTTTEPVEPDEHAGHTHALPQKGGLILVVDDNDAAAWGIGKLLEIKGFRVEYAYDGEQTLEKAARLTPEAVLLDIGLPDRDGYAVARDLRKDGYEGTLIALSGFSDEEDRIRGHEAGFDHYLVKPVGIAELRRVLSQQTS